MKKQIDFLKKDKKVLNDFESKIFLIGKQRQGKGLKKSTPKQMHQRLSIASAKVKAGNTSEDLLN